MQSIKYLTITLLGFLSLSSCEDIIELDLYSSEPQTIIEASINATTLTATVLLTESTSFYDSSEPTTLSGASILLIDDNGLNYNLVESEPGFYQIDNIDILNATSFALSINHNGEFYEASAVVPSQIALDSIIVTSGGGPPLGGNGSERVFAQFQDALDVKNYYRIKTYENDSLLVGTYTLIDDELRGDGEVTRVGVRALFEVENTVTLELLSTSKGYYEYFLQLSSQSGDGGSSTTPFNPRGNFTNNGFGYFGIYHSSVLSIEL